MKAIWPFRHLGLKVLSLGLAVLLWMVVAGEETVERGLRVPLELQQFPTGLELAERSRRRSWMSACAARRARSSRVGTGDIVAVLDLRAARPGRRLFQLTPEQVRAPFGVRGRAGRRRPASRSSSSTRGDTAVPVAPSVEGDPAPGYVVGKITVDPAMVEIIGTGERGASRRPKRSPSRSRSAARASRRHRERHRRPARSGASAEDAAARHGHVQVRPGPRERPGARSARPPARISGPI